MIIFIISHLQKYQIWDIVSGMQEEIAQRLKLLRQRSGMTQSDLAEAIGTSQSAVNRMESGLQNFSLEMLERLSQAINQDLVKIPDGTLNFTINGGKKLHGEITTRISKNATVALLCASLLNKGQTIIKNAPKIEEVHRIIEVLVSIGVKVSWEEKDLIIKPPTKLRLENINIESAIRTRSIIMFLGPLMHIIDDFKLPFAGGCKLGDRSVKPHIYALEKMGMTATESGQYYDVKVNGKSSDTVVLFEMGDTVTENILMAAAGKPTTTTIKFASSNYMVQDLCFYLQKLGVYIQGIVTSTLVVTGRKNLNKNVVYRPSEHPIESMMFLSLAATTKSEITIRRCPIDFLEIELLHLEKMNFKYLRSEQYLSENGKTKLVDITTKPSNLVALSGKITSGPYPALNIDNLPFFVPVAASAEGRTLIHDWVYENRAVYYTDLNKLGAKVELADPHRVFVNGPTQWQANEIVSPPALRPSAIILIGMLAAPGKSVLRNVYSINRGYESLATRLQTIGADIEVTD